MELPVASAASEVLGALLPFVLLIGFWLFLMRHMRRRTPAQDQTAEKLEEIRRELERIRRAIEAK